MSPPSAYTASAGAEPTKEGAPAPTLGPKTELTCFTWNIAAINNNPFEYYATLEDEPQYEEIMLAVQKLIDEPGEQDVSIPQVFSQAMFEKLMQGMTEQGFVGIEKVGEMWQNDFSNRKIISGFLTDKDIGKKRLTSMPDRCTNTINDADGGKLHRPTIINNYQTEMPTLDAWFDQWYNFMFHTQVSVKNKEGAVESKLVCSLLQPISRHKYPAVTEEEEACSVALQVLSLAIFDAVLVHILNVTAGEPSKWFGIKMKLCNALVVNKQQNVLNVLTEQAGRRGDVVFLQEVAGAFVEIFQKSSLSQSFTILAPKCVDHVRDQNSLILVSREVMASDLAEEIDVRGDLGPDVKTADGDLCSFVVPLQFGGTVQKVILSSFHGDTAGLASTPVVSALRRAAAQRDLPILIGLDANTHALEDPEGKHKSVASFLEDLKVGPAVLHHSWTGDTKTWCTTSHARSYLQPQLNKAIPYDQRHTSKLIDANPKDYILFSSAFAVASPAAKDNTGKGQYIEGLDLPSLTFPSDHCLLSTVLRWGVPARKTGSKTCTIL